jgi:hypothetical protein
MYGNLYDPWPVPLNFNFDRPFLEDRSNALEYACCAIRGFPFWKQPNLSFVCRLANPEPQHIAAFKVPWAVEIKPARAQAGR